MAGKRSYRLLCPIARALDAVGDRWAMLILRDLQAGPARYQQLQLGLNVATNLLSTRLAELTKAGLVHKPHGSGRSAYELTDLGRRTDRILWELARFGSLLPPDPNPRVQGNLRTMAVTVRMLFESVPRTHDFVFRLLVDNDIVTLKLSSSKVELEYGESETTPQLTARLDYVAFLELGEGRMPYREFVTHHLEIIEGAEYRDAFLSLLGAALRSAGGRS